MTRPVLGIVCGMAAEAGALGGWANDPRVAVAISAGRPLRAEAEARRLAGGGVRTLLSWGIAGALDPALRPGTLVTPSQVVAPDGTLLALASAAAGSDPRPPPSGGTDGEGAAAPRPVALLAGSEEVLLDPAAKAELRARTGAAAVDMESHRVAAAAAAAGLPCIAVRAISDPAERALPRLATDALDDRGRPRIGAVLAGLLRHPGDLPALLAAGRDSRAALAALRDAADGLIPALLAR